MINDETPQPHRRADTPARPRQFFVSRHAGAIEWARQHPWSIRAEFLPHLDLARIVPGDVVIGTLPVHLAAAVCARGARYLHLSMALSARQRGAELTAEEMDAAGAHLVSYRVIIEDSGSPLPPDRRA